jgi:hypothetical protein
VRTQPSPEGRTHGTLASLQGTWRTGDAFYLATDALSHWILDWQEKRRKPWRALEDLRELDQETFAAFMDRLRSRGDLRNDDVTLVALAVG